MSAKRKAQFLRFTICAAAAVTSVSAWAQAPAPLEEQFRDPPESARPRVWWHWMNGNVTKDGIAKDFAWMKSVGIGGMTNFDANLRTPQIVPQRLVYMTPEWKDAFHFAASEAERLGLELTIASSPGWSETGGPWVKPEDGLKKLVWNETRIAGGKPFRGRLAALPGITGPFQNMPIPSGILESLTGGKAAEAPTYSGPIAVLAVPDMAVAEGAPKGFVSGGKSIDPGHLRGDDLVTGVDVPRGTAEAPTTVVYQYDAPQTMRSANIFIAGAKTMFAKATLAVALEASEDGKSWNKIADVPMTEVPSTVSFAPVTAKNFRLVLTPLPFSGSNLGAPAEGIIDVNLLAPPKGDTISLRQFRLSNAAAIDQFEAKAGFALVNDYFSLGGPKDGAAGPAASQVIDVTSHVKPDGTLDWVAPKGNWRIIQMGYSLLGTTNHPAPPEATGLEVDKFDCEAVRRYIDHYLAMYKDAAGPGMLGAHGIRALLTDSIEVGAANWTPKMIEQFKAHRGYDPTPWLPTLSGVLIGSRNDADRFLFDYRRTLAELMASEHYGTIAKAAHEQGLKVYGEALEDNRPSLGDDMAMRTHTDIPMSAMWTFPRDKQPNPSYVADIKGAASVAHIYGQNLVAAESMTSALTYWADSPRTLKHVIDLEFVTGVNRPVIHTSVHQPVDDKVPGLSLMIFGQYFNRHEAWAPLAKAWVDYISRNALMLQQGRNLADVGYVYGEEAPLTGLYGRQLVADAPRTHAYDFVNNDALNKALANDGAELTTPGGARYKALYLGGSSREMSLATLRRIHALVEGGATVIGLKPTHNPSLADTASPEAKQAYDALLAQLWPGAGMATVGKGRVIASGDVEAALAGIGVGSDFRYTGGQADSDIPFLHRKLPDGDAYFLVNRQLRDETIGAHFRVTGMRPEIWHAESGKSEPVSYRSEGGETVVPLTLAGEESLYVVFRRAGPASAVVAPKASVPLGQLAGPWTVAFQQGRGAPSSVSLPQLAGLEQNADAGVKYFSGVATYSKDFAAPKGWKAGQPLWLDLGDVHELAEVSVNGTSAGIVWHKPYRVDLGRLAHAGSNHLTVRVANLWINRLIGDAQPNVTSKVTWTALPTYRPDAPLSPSGLLGPVTLQGEGK
ncbi:glycosyl hydrolase [Novosphingobium rosa]|uniref:glycosyl hydrolase n=1 Tax=Novosphingobium rosa TaxID=76978 RepID=UPI00082AB860|nr:glycosyl hydrolase [Novosphingobium rosa]